MFLMHVVFEMHCLTIYVLGKTGFLYAPNVAEAVRNLSTK